MNLTKKSGIQVLQCCSLWSLAHIFFICELFGPVDHSIVLTGRRSSDHQPSTNWTRPEQFDVYIFSVQLIYCLLSLGTTQPLLHNYVTYPSFCCFCNIPIGNVKRRKKRMSRYNFVFPQSGTEQTNFFPSYLL